MTLTQKKPSGLLCALFRALIWLYRWNLGRMEEQLWEYARKHPVAFEELVPIILGERLPADKKTCRKVADSVPLISLTPTG